MSAEAFLDSRRGILGQLLAGTTPRCFWTPSARYANPAFDRAFPLDFVPPQNAERAEIDGFDCTFIPLQIASEQGIFIIATALAQPESDARLARLPEIVRAITNPDLGITDVHRVIDRLLDLRPPIFSGAMLFLSRGRSSFVLVRESGGVSGNSRSWARWPLQRLFVTRRPCVIRNPLDNLQALAVPFSVAPAQRYVVLATLRDGSDLAPAERVFLRCLESLLLPPTEAREHLRAYAMDSIRTDPVAASPSFAWYGPDNSTQLRIQRLLEQRGWELWCVSNFGDVLKTIESRAVDILILDGSAREDPVPMLRAARHVSGILNVPILFFDSRPATAEIEALAERCLSTGAKADEIFRAVKDIVRLVPKRRTDALRLAAREFSSLLQNARDCTELARSLALAAKELVGDWAAVTLFDHSGNLYTAEFPGLSEPMLDRVPLTLLSGYAVMRSRVDAEFFAEVTDDTATQLRLEAFSPVSGATLPIADGGRIVGTLVALSTSRRMHEPEFEALLELADVGARAFADVQTRILRSQALANVHSPMWEQLSIGDCELNVYRGPNAVACFRMAALDATRVAVTVVYGSDADTSFEIAEAALQELATAVHQWEAAADAVDATASAFESGSYGVLAGILTVGDTSLFTFAASRFPSPVQIPLSGPAPALATPDRHQGNVAIRPRTVTLVYGPETQAIDSAKIVTAVQGELRRGAPNVVQPLPMLAEDPFAVAFIGITKRSFGAER